jgi:hypothetical protein
MTKLLIGVLSLALVGAGGVVAAVDGFDSEPVRAVTLPGAATGERTTTGATTEAATTGTTTTPTETAEDEDVPAVTTSGRDELEDELEEDDDRGRGRGHGGGDDDRSGSNSGQH